MNYRSSRKQYLSDRDAAQALACIEFMQDALQCATRRALADKDQKYAQHYQRAINTLRVARRAIGDANPGAWGHMVKARNKQRDIDRQRKRATPIDNMGVPDEN